MSAIFVTRLSSKIAYIHTNEVQCLNVLMYFTLTKLKCSNLLALLSKQLKVCMQKDIA